MNITIKAKNIELTDAIKKYVKKKVAGLEKFIHDDSKNILTEVEVGKISHHHKSGEVYYAGAVISFKGKTLNITAERKEDLYAAIDEMKAKIERECVAVKNKALTLEKRGAGKVKKALRRSK